ncbi:hypothetical protein [Winogradskyella sp. 3972H.M.0a.05]|uniref:hypothetical protein n=1 Tax=Winogradskyella sp. 3972H.M.0a.05 TaxID=2950277 RepID=UPI00339494EA
METKEQHGYPNLDVGPKNRNLTIIVKANQLFNSHYQNPTERDKVIDNCTSLLDDEGLESAYGDNNRNFTTIIYMDYNMIWEIALADPSGKDKDYKVHLVDITQDSAESFFTQKVLRPERDGNIYGKVVDKINLDGKEEDYTIHFYVSKGRESSPVLPIDPKLQIRKRLSN